PEVYFEGFLIGLAAFVLIGIFHPVVIRVEYHYGKRVWPIFLIAGLAATIVSLFLDQRMLSVLFGVLGFALFWSTLELFKQHERVVKGQAKKNPKRKYS
ncbi:MAG TPA: DUF4491 family protein, partial [Bacteroidales bacterium]|nr:DUF4491 family protein [Bacteroidales bacterium]